MSRIEHFNAGATDHQFDQARALRGAGKIEAVFGEHHLEASPPWPRAARRKDRLNYDPQAVHEVLSRPPEIEEFDPVNLHATQRSITRGGVSYYMGDQYKRTGQTFADMADPGNRYPVVYERDDGKNLLLSGHHRATAALLQNEALRARRIRGGWGPARGAS